ncbi:PREDICTED: tectonic-1 [Nanorana parkeri]|uniref:tectonic-1 n=1 Tax=Nanorana parkeri TaxID=125878 RepID=UPI00085484F1|nr:PREDICTED: tectonic-1 [Nanorana parkeri]
MSLLWLLLAVLSMLEAGYADFSGTEPPDSRHNTVRICADNETEVWELLENETKRGTQEEPSSTPQPGTPTPSPASQTPVIVREPKSFDQVQARSVPVLVTSVSNLCVCDLLEAQCDVNCCCDPDCTAADFSVFSGCSVSAVTGDTRLCSQEAVLYSINSSTTVPQRVTETVQVVNLNVFCIQTTNYQPALSYITPDEPTEASFDSLLREFGGNQFNTNTVLNTVVSTEARNRSRYEYGVPILTKDSYLKLPAPLGTNTCTDSSPIGFLERQNLICTRDVQLENCSIPALTLGTYTAIQILPAPNSQSGINVSVQAVTMRSITGTLVRINFSDQTPTYNNITGICTNVVLGGSYSIIYTAQGEIRSVLASFTLGTISRTPFQQSFQISFTEEGAIPVTLSGNPGYVVGMPLIAGFRLPQSGIVQSTNRFGQLTLLQSSVDQSCLTEQGKRAAVLFGYNMMSGCKLRLNSFNYTIAAFCQLAGVTILNALKGEQFPEYVAQFGNSQPEKVLDWVAINSITAEISQKCSADASMCKIPVSLELEVQWTKFGSLVNPQAQIVKVTEKISYAFIPDNLGGDRTVQISTAVTFLDVSQAASPGYKAQPTMDAKLPFDFFHPFV